jgi:hypothetical protein
MAGHLATLCDKWGANGAYGSAVRPAKNAEAATCKSCLKNAAVTA